MTAQSLTYFSSLPSLFSPLPTPKEMEQWDLQSQSIGFPGIVLMENAAHAACTLLLRLFPSILKQSCAIFAGSGNNGGDAVCIGRILHEAGAKCTIFLTKDFSSYRGCSATELTIAKNSFIPISPFEAFEPADYQFLVDGLLGTGFHGPLREETLHFIRKINAVTHAVTIAVDIPSGLDGETGFPQPEAVHANATLCMEAIKQGLCMPQAFPYTGKLYSVPFGIPKSIKQQYPASAYLLRTQLAHTAPRLVDNGHKTMYGHVGILGGGDKATTGAANLAARAALRMGAGLLHCIAPNALGNDIRLSLPEIMLCPLGKPLDETWPETIPENLLELFPRLSSLVIGPGMGTNEHALHFLGEILHHKDLPPLILDADALTLLAKEPKLLQYIRSCDCITPHPGEAARLLATTSHDIQNDRQKAVERLCALQKGVVILKGARTLIKQEASPLLVSPWDIPQLSIAGAGDILAGILGSLVAQRSLWKEDEPSSLLLAAIGVVIHAMAAKELAKNYPKRGILAQEIADAIVRVRTTLSTKQNRSSSHDPSKNP